MSDVVLSGYDRSALTTFYQNFLYSVAMGPVPGFSFVDKFGENPDVDTGTTPEDIWEGGGAYTYDADETAPIVSLISDNAADTEPIQVEGLDINGLAVRQTITLTGTTRVALTTPLWRVFRIQNVGTSDIAGTVYCYVGTGGVPAAADLRAVVGASNQTLMSLYTIPADKVGFLLEDEVGASRTVTAGEIRAALKVRKFGGVFTTKRRVNLSNAGTSVNKDTKIFPTVLPGKTDIKQSIESVSANSTGVFGTFQLLLIDSVRLPLTFLTSIGQPS